MSTDAALQKELVEQLADVKKGKTRRFVMLIKGGKIQSLIVFKKGSLEAYIKQAKESGSGQVCYGQVSGKGDEITFTVAQADGFKDPPVKDVPLKVFLTDSGVKGRPKCEVVDSHKTIADDDAATSPTAPSNSRTAASSPIAGTDTATSPYVDTVAGIDPNEPDAASEAPKNDPAQEKWEKQAPKLEKVVALCEAKQFPVFDKVKSIYALALKKAEAGDYATALTAGDKLQELAKSASAAALKQAPPNEPAPSGYNAYNSGGGEPQDESNGAPSDDSNSEAGQTYVDSIETLKPSKPAFEASPYTDSVIAESEKRSEKSGQSSSRSESDLASVQVPEIYPMYRAADGYLDRWRLQIFPKARKVREDYAKLYQESLDSRSSELIDLAAKLQDDIVGLMPPDGNYENVSPERIKFIQELSALAAAAGDFDDARLTKLLARFEFPDKAENDEGEPPASDEELILRTEERKQILRSTEGLGENIKKLREAVTKFVKPFSKRLSELLKQARALNDATAVPLLTDAPEFKTNRAIAKLEKLKNTDSDSNPQLTELKLQGLRAADAVRAAQELHRDYFLGRWEQWLDHAERMSDPSQDPVSEETLTKMPALQKAVADLHKVAQAIADR